MLTSFLNATQGNKFKEIQDSVDGIVRSGYSAAQILSQLHDLIVDDASLHTKQKASLTLQLSQTDKALVDGSDEQLQLMNLACRMGSIMTAAV